MAKTNQNGGQAAKAASSAPAFKDQESPPAADEQPAAAPWRRIALCIKGCSLYLGGILQKVHGGTWLTDQAHVRSAAADTAHFRFVDVVSPEYQIEVMTRHAETLSKLRAMASELGMVVLHDGQFTLNK